MIKDQFDRLSCWCYPNITEHFSMINNKMWPHFTNVTENYPGQNVSSLSYFQITEETIFPQKVSFILSDDDHSLDFEFKKGTPEK